MMNIIQEISDKTKQKCVLELLSERLEKFTILEKKIDIDLYSENELFIEKTGCTLFEIEESFFNDILILIQNMDSKLFENLKFIYDTNQELLKTQIDFFIKVIRVIDKLNEFKNSGINKQQYNRDVKRINNKFKELQKFSNNRIKADKIPAHPNDTLIDFKFYIVTELLILNKKQIEQYINELSIYLTDKQNHFNELSIHLTDKQNHFIEILIQAVEEFIFNDSTNKLKNTNLGKTKSFYTKDKKINTMIKWHTEKKKFMFGDKE